VRVRVRLMVLFRARFMFSVICSNMSRTRVIVNVKVMVMVRGIVSVRFRSSVRAHFMIRF
jgi:hypothetical protein